MKSSIITIASIYNVVIGIVGFLSTIAFIFLKLLGMVDASWWFVLIPLLVTYFFEVKVSTDDRETES